MALVRKHGAERAATNGLGKSNPPADGWGDEISYPFLFPRAGL